MLNASRPILIISDLQIPFENKKALEFCKYVVKHYNIPKENILNAGDEIDILHGGEYPKDPDAEVSPINEIEISRERLKAWGAAFPKMKLCLSNHGLRWIRKAINAQIPSQVIKSYQELYQMPKGWEWREEWRFTQLKHPFRLIHGQGYSGKDGHRNAAQDAQMSTAIGHLHSHAGINHVKMMGSERIWSMNVGCLIDVDAVAFKYGKYNRAKPCLGVGIVCNEGKMPIWIPLE